MIAVLLRVCVPSVTTLPGLIGALYLILIVLNGGKKDLLWRFSALKSALTAIPLFLILPTARLILPVLFSDYFPEIVQSPLSKIAYSIFAAYLIIQVWANKCVSIKSEINKTSNSLLYEFTSLFAIFQSIQTFVSSVFIWGEIYTLYSLMELFISTWSHTVLLSLLAYHSTLYKFTQDKSYKKKSKLSFLFIVLLISILPSSIIKGYSGHAPKNWSDMLIMTDERFQQYIPNSLLKEITTILGLALSLVTISITLYYTYATLPTTKQLKQILSTEQNSAETTQLD